MKISDLHIDGFGVWSAIDFQSLSPEITVFYGRNEAGKSTLLQFVRSICFGFTPERRGFVTSVQTGRAGGAMNLVCEKGRHQVARHDEGIASANGFGTLKITGPDGTLVSDGQLRSLLGNLDEVTFNNVFAVGLREIQELGTLSDTAAAQYLYDLSAGRDRVSLSEVLRELENSRQRLTGTPERPALLADLVAQRDRLQQEVDELLARTPRYGRVAAQGAGLNQTYCQVEAEIGQWQRKIRLLDLASVLRGKWQERQTLDAQLTALSNMETLPPDLMQKLEKLNYRLRSAKQRNSKGIGELRILRSEAAAIKINEPLYNNGAKIEVLAEQVPWSTALEKQIHALEDELLELEEQFDTRKQQLNTHATPHIQTHAVAPVGAHDTASNRRGWSYFRPLAKRLKAARAEHHAAQEQLGQHRQAKAEIQSTVGSKLGGRSPQDIVADVDKAGQLVTNLRRRIQVEDRLQQLNRQKTEIEGDGNEAFEEILLPPWLLTALGGFFIMGVVLILAGLFYPGTTSKIGWWMALMGLAGTAVAGAAKWFFEHSAEQHAQTCDKQLSTLSAQLKKLEIERDELDGQIPKGGGALAARLQTAETQLAALQELFPAGVQRVAAVPDVQSAEERAKRAEEDYQKAKSGWRKLLRAAGLEENLSPGDVAKQTQEDDRQHHTHRQQQLVVEREHHKLSLEQTAKREEVASLERALASKRDEIANRKRELEAIVTRVRHTLADAGLLAAGRSPFEQLVTLRKELDEQRALVDRRRSIHRKRKLLKRDVLKLRELAKLQQKKRQHLLRRAGVSDYAELRRRIAEQARLDELRRGRDALAHEIAGTLTGEFSEDAMKDHLNATVQSFDATRKEADTKLQMAQQRLSALAQQRGEWLQQAKATQSDRRLQQKQLELACIEKKLADAIERWQVLAATQSLLDATRREFESERQPEALREASSYFEKLTEGRYRRVWTPFGEHTLRVDDAEGQTWACEKLSRGTREQLFLALRLALVAQYSRRGVHAVPLVLDDVLVNYDTSRARAAAKVLREFAAQGHQLLIFTCHEHILETFQELRVDCRNLRGDLAPPPVFQEPPAHQELPFVREPAIKEPPTHDVFAEPEPVKRRTRRERTFKREPQEPSVPLPVIEVAPPPKVVVRPEVAAVAPPEPLPLKPNVRRYHEPTVVNSPPVVVEHHRLDSAHEPTVRYTRRSKWTAEEFDGEHEDWVVVRAQDRRLRAGYAPVAVADQVEVLRPAQFTEAQVGQPVISRVIGLPPRPDNLPEIVIERRGAVHSAHHGDHAQHLPDDEPLGTA